MSDDPRIDGGLRTQLETRALALGAGAKPLGWKAGITVPQVQRKLGLEGAVIGYLTTATQLQSGDEHSLAGGTSVAVEPEVALWLDADVDPTGSAQEALAAVGGLGALEVVDLDRPLDELEAVLANDVFHRAVVLGPRHDGALSDASAVVLRDGEPLHELDVVHAAGDLGALLLRLASLLAGHCERLRAGEVVIAGSLTMPLPVEPDTELALDLGPLGSTSLRFVR